MKKILITCFCILFFHQLFAAVNVQVIGGRRYSSVLVNGSTSAKYDIVFIGDGFRLQDQAAFNARVEDAVNALRNMPPYSANMCSFNIWRVNVISVDSGVDHPNESIFRNTELDCTYGTTVERCIGSNSPAKCNEAAAFAPAADAVFVLVNDMQWGGCAGGLVFSSISPGFAGIITHELGHKIGSLADEYDCYNCATDLNRTYPAAGAEPTAVNITKQTVRASIKWNSLIAAATPLPTTSDVPAGVVGIWEGGGYYRFGLYRPQSSCHMRSTGSAFCAVCSGEMNRILSAKCTACERDPGSFACLISRLRYIIYIREPRYVFEPPLCCFCPLMDDIRVRIILEELDARQYTVVVKDQNQKVVAEGKINQSEKTNGIVLEYNEKKGANYSIEVNAKNGKALNTALLVRPKMYRNGKAVQL